MFKKIIKGKKVNVAINGFGRIGRATFKALLNNPKINVVAINDLADIKNLANLLQYDSVFGKYEQKVSAGPLRPRSEASKGSLIVGKDKIPVLAQKDPSELPWGKLGVDVVLECTGLFRDKEGAMLHLSAGAKKVIISAPAKSEEIKTIVMGVNDDKIKKTDKIISMASCTTNCLAPITAVLCKSFGVKKAIMTTVHGYTSSQNLVDGPHKDLRRGRAAAVNIIPTTTGAAIATTKTLPEMEGKFDGMAMRVPVPNGSIVDAVFLLKKRTSEHKVNEALRKAAGSGKFKNILTVSKEPLVSTDIIGNSASSIVDLEMTKVIDGDLLKVISWYDNETGYSNRLAEMAGHFGKM